MVDDAIWPDRRTDNNQNTRHTALSRLRRWLGSDLTGPYLSRVSLQLRVATDWEAFLTLVGADPAAMMDRSTAELTAALRQVGGVPFAGVRPDRYQWADRLRVEMTIRIGAAAAVLAERFTRSTSLPQAAWAASVGLQVMPGDEHLEVLRDSALALA